MHAFALNITTDDVHYIGDKNKIYVDSDKEFILTIRNHNDNIVKEWHSDDIIQNDKDTYKVFSEYPTNWIEGHYSVKAETKDDIITKDIEIKKSPVTKHIKNIFSDFFRWFLGLLSP